MSKVLWDKGYSIDERMQQLTVGKDIILDKELVIWDCIGSAVHAKMLHSIGLLTRDELSGLLVELKKIYERGQKKEIEIPFELEDVHNVIENILSENLGDIGLKIHAGRSRNDQILVTTRLYLRNMLLEWIGALIHIIHVFFTRYDEVKNIGMPGYTHMQPAMPSSVGMWLHAFIEGLLELIQEGLMLYEIVNKNPLGASAGFGSNLNLNRELTTSLLGFLKVQRSPIDCNNSRGRYELKIVQFGAAAASLFEKFACDVMLYTTREYGFFKLADGLTTGSSIMPQKKNYDIAELLRGRASKIRSAASEIEWIIAKLTSSYNRDFQYTKEPVIRADHEFRDIIDMVDIIISNLQVNQERLNEVMYPDLYATYEANRLAESGVPYRKAYREVARKVLGDGYEAIINKNDFAVVEQQTQKYVEDAGKELTELEEKFNSVFEEKKKIEAEIFRN